MKRFFPIAVFLVLLLSSCGKKGTILPPIQKAPRGAKKFEIFQRGAGVILKWENPTWYIDGELLERVEGVEIWLAREEKLSYDEEEESLELYEFGEIAELVDVIEREKLSEYQIEGKDEEPPLFKYIYKITENDFFAAKWKSHLFEPFFIFPKKLTFSLRVLDKRKRKSPLSSLLSVSPAVLPLPPHNLKATLLKDKIEIEWRRPEKKTNQSFPPNIVGYNIYRTEDEEEPQMINSEVIEDEVTYILFGKYYLISLSTDYLTQTKIYHDEDFLFGKTYRYFVRASATTSSPFLESEDSEVVEIFTEDTFPPEPPSGLVSIIGENYITLSWDRNLEEDLAGYKVWRKEEGEEEYVLLTSQMIQENSYTDRNVEKNKRYYYAISALDEFGNESVKSKDVTEIIEGGFP